MGKGKNSSAFYEVLKSSSAGDHDVGEPMASPGKFSGTQQVAPSYGKPAVSSGGVGENIVRISYNTAAFLVMIIVGLLFVSFALGVKYGKARDQRPANRGLIAEKENEKRESRRVSGKDVSDRTPDAKHDRLRPKAKKKALPKNGKWWTVRLIEYPNKTLEEKTEAIHLANVIKKKLVSSGLEEANVYYEPRSEGRKHTLAVFYGKIADPESSEAKGILKKIRKVKRKGGRAMFPNAAIEKMK